jgi:hypothetical protein
MSRLKQRLVVTRAYARAISVLFDRVAFSLSNLGLGPIRYQIIRNHLLNKKSLVSQYRALRSLQTTLQTP